MTDSVDEAGEDGLNASLKHLRSILMIDGTSNSKQVVKFEEQIKHLESQLKREKSLRAKQESSYEALSKYNKELTLQLESLAKANECNENKFNTANRALQTEKVNLHTQHEEWKAEKEKLKKELNEYKNEAEKSKIRFLYFQQQVKELTNVSDGLKGDIVKLEKEMEESRGGYEEKLRNEAKQRDDLKSMMQETETKLKKEVRIQSCNNERLHHGVLELNNFIFRFQLEQVNQKLKEAKEEYSGAIESIGAFLKKEEHENTSIDSLSDESKSFEDLSEELHLKIAALGEKRVELDEELELSNQINEEKAIELEKWYERIYFLSFLQNNYMLLTSFLRLKQPGRITIGSRRVEDTQRVLQRRKQSKY